MPDEKIERPAVCTEGMLKFLDELRASAVTNMFGGASYLQKQYGYLTQREAKAVLLYWISIN